MSDDTAHEYLTPPAPIDGPINLADPDPAWDEQYAREQFRIQRALTTRALQVEHVGSTAVPGLTAKPIIDIVLAVADSADEPEYVPALEAAGYVLHYREPAWHEHRMLIDHDPDVQVHVFTVGDPEVQRMLMFRDRLRSSPEKRDSYQITKRELAARHWTSIEDYADAKSSVIEQVLGSDLSRPDFDSDGLGGSQEERLGRDPRRPDSDDDGLGGRQEERLGRDPKRPDSDDDGLGGRQEERLGRDPKRPDSDDDGLGGRQEERLGRDPKRPDSDDDGLGGRQEERLGRDPKRPDSDDDGLGGSGGAAWQRPKETRLR